MCQDHEHEHDREHEHAHSRRRALDGLRLVLTGKGGVGKTSLTAVLARLFARAAHRVLALDADPQMNLPYALGIPPRTARGIVPLSQSAAYVEEKIGARSGSGWGLFLRLNPDVEDVVDRFGVVGPDGVRLVVMGTVTQPATGCLCPENVLLGSVATHVSLRRDEVVLMDTQAGVEHFGRSLAKGFRHAAVVTDPTFNGVSVALHAARLAAELGIPNIHLVVNRVRGEGDLERVRGLIHEGGGFSFTSQHALAHDPELSACEPDVTPALEAPLMPFAKGVAAFRDALVESQTEAVA